MSHRPGVQIPPGERIPANAGRYWAQRWSPAELGSDLRRQCSLAGAGPQSKCHVTVLGLLTEARGWNQLLLLNYCWVGPEMNSKQNRKKEPFLPSSGLLGPRLQDPKRKTADQRDMYSAESQSRHHQAEHRRVDLGLRQQSTAKWDPQYGNPCTESETQVRAQLSQGQVARSFILPRISFHHLGPFPLVLIRYKGCLLSS